MTRSHPDCVIRRHSMEESELLLVNEFTALGDELGDHPL